VQSSADQLDEGPRPARLPTRFGRNTFANYASSITALAVGLLVTPVLVHGLGAERYGTWVLIGSSMSYFNLLQFGFATATVRYVAAARAQDDLDRVRRVIATSFVLLSAPGLAVLLAAPGLAFLLPKIFAASSGTTS
jgi:O-antigen/teichoic acid export membrane protein